VYITSDCQDQFEFKCEKFWTDLGLCAYNACLHEDNYDKLEVIKWVVSLKNAAKKCVNINTASYWQEPGISAAKVNK